MFFSFKIDGDELDKRMGGGVYVGQLFTILGDNSEGKTLLSLRLAYGFLKNGTSVAYVSSQMPVREFISFSDALGYPVLNEIISGTFMFVTPVFILRKPKKARLDDLLNNEKIREKNVLIIDSLNPAMFYDFDINTYMEKLRKFSENRVVILTASPSSLDDATTLRINQLSTTIVTLHSKELGGMKRHFIDLVKYPMVVRSIQQSIPFRVEPGRGLIVEISSVS
ncbi:flagella-related protein H [Thermoplasma volcanium GSS1]|uniref:Flagella-related protein H n=1 Tax=Thermoplasma volcanium (strain ATCC 51530 / DSM 4299 / JCM 9571 / NBRC 15438 / GSS1) TaxID=273116 RepID=Q97B47_THEVO|nr:ATPase domain-containing protein [Thermoplasma volcanium]BAB59754.1 flagella-related protein H [Thermoplasma volcanium GSS1]